MPYLLFVCQYFNGLSYVMTQFAMLLHQYSYNFSFTTSYMYIAILKHYLSQNNSILQTVVLKILFKNILTKSSITSSDVGLHLYLIFEYPTYHGLTTYVHEPLIMHHP